MLAAWGSGRNDRYETICFDAPKNPELAAGGRRWRRQEHTSVQQPIITPKKPRYPLKRTKKWRSTFLRTVHTAFLEDPKARDMCALHGVAPNTMITYLQECSTQWSSADGKPITPKRVTIGKRLGLSTKQIGRCRAVAKSLGFEQGYARYFAAPGRLVSRTSNYTVLHIPPQYAAPAPPPRVTPGPVSNPSKQQAAEQVKDQQRVAASITETYLTTGALPPKPTPAPEHQDKAPAVIDLTTSPQPDEPKRSACQPVARQALQAARDALNAVGPP